jgi:hypothetical protein
MIQRPRQEDDLGEEEKPKTNSGATCDRIQVAKEEGGSREDKPKTGSEFLCAHDCTEIL